MSSLLHMNKKYDRGGQLCGYDVISRKCWISTPIIMKLEPLVVQRVPFCFNKKINRTSLVTNTYKKVG